MRLTLADSTVIDNLTVNGTDLVSAVQADETALTIENLSAVTFTNENGSTAYKDLAFVRQAEYADGWHICLRQLTEAELTQINNDLAITSLFEMLLG